MIPELSIGSLIGKNGTTIKQLQKDTETEISIKKEIKGLQDRRVDITGQAENALQAVVEIYKIVEKGSNKTSKQDQQPQGHVKTRFLFPNSLVGFIIGKQGQFTKKLQQKYGVNIKFFNDKDPPCKMEESICVLIGDLQGVQKSVYKVLEKVQDYLKNHKIRDDGICMLVPSNLVSKLIGQGGCLIKEISQRSKGCNIKVMSEKNQEKSPTNVIVLLSGTLESKQLAATIILEKIEEFKGKITDQQSSQQEEPKREQFRNEHFDRDKNGNIRQSQSPIPNDRKENNYRSKRGRNNHSQSPQHRSSHYRSSQNRSPQQRSPQHRSPQQRSPQYRQSSNQEKFVQRRKDSRDLEKSTFIDRDGVTRICINVVVPNNLVPMIIGKNGNIIKEIMNKTNAQIAFSREEDQDYYKTHEGNKGRVCQIKGTANQTTHAFETLINQIIRIENNPAKKEGKE